MLRSMIAYRGVLLRVTLLSSQTVARPISAPMAVPTVNCRKSTFNASAAMAQVPPENEASIPEVACATCTSTIVRI